MENTQLHPMTVRLVAGDGTVLFIGTVDTDDAEQFIDYSATFHGPNRLKANVTDVASRFMPTLEATAMTTYRNRDAITFPAGTLTFSQDVAFDPEPSEWTPILNPEPITLTVHFDQLTGGKIVRAEFNPPDGVSLTERPDGVRVDWVGEARPAQADVTVDSWNGQPMSEVDDPPDGE